MAAILNTLKKVPMPIFGTAATAVSFGTRKAASAPRYAAWGVPVVAGGLWFVWPAVDEEWKQTTFGSGPAAEESAAAAEEKPVVVELTEAAMTKVETAHLPEPEKALTEEEKAVMKAMSEGDFTELEKEWDAFAAKAMNPEDDDDDDDDDEDDEEEEGEEEEEEEDE